MRDPHLPADRLRLPDRREHRVRDVRARDERPAAQVSAERPYGTTRPVYVLTSEDTFSGAEEFAYDVQTQRRGEIVGDTTGGGAHPGGMRRVTEQFGV